MIKEISQEFKTVKLGPKNIEIPKEWSVETLEYTCDKVTDGTHDTPKTLEDGYCFITAKHITNGKIDFNSCLYISKRDHEENIRRCCPEKDDILFTHIGTIGEVVRIKEDRIFSIKNISLFKPSKSCIDSKYLEYYLKGKIFQDQIFIVTQGGVQNFIGLNTLKTMPVVIPKIEEQKKIAEILSTVDKAISKTEKIIEKTKILNKGLMQKLIIKGIDHDKFKKVRLGPKELETPKKWEMVKLKDISDIKSSNVNKKSNNTETPVLLCNYMDVYKNKYIKDNMNFMEATATKKEIERFSLKYGDVIITKDSETADDIAQPAVVIDNLNNVLCGYHLALLRPKAERINGIFLSKLLSSKPINDQFIILAQGLTRFGLNVSSIKDALIPLPSMKEQEKIIDILSSIDKKIQNEIDYKQKLQEIKKGLMQDLLTGKKRVKVDNN